MIVLRIVTANEMSGTVRFESYVYLCRQIIDNKELTRMLFFVAEIPVICSTAYSYIPSN